MTHIYISYILYIVNYFNILYIVNKYVNFKHADVQN